MKVNVNYPKPLETRSGCKVGWLIYGNREDAEVASEVARRYGDYLLREGYDFGWLAVGEITLLPDGRYSVVIP